MKTDDPKIITEMKRRRALVAGSSNMMIPSEAVPTAPIPVQTAYTVPIGRSWTTFASNTILMMSATTVPTVGSGSESPSEYSNPIAQAISNSPATKERTTTSL